MLGLNQKPPLARVFTNSHTNTETSFFLGQRVAKNIKLLKKTLWYMAPIRNGHHVMRLAPDNPERIAQVREMMKRQVMQRVHRVDDLLNVARIRIGKIELKKEQTKVTIDVLNLVTETI